MRSEKLDRLPPYVLSVVNELKAEARRRGQDVIDLGFGNPNHPTPDHIVDKLVEAARDPRNHHYSASRGIPNLRRAMARGYRRRYAVELDPDSQVIATIGAKEGLSHFVMGMIQRGDTVLCPDPAYPIHGFSVVIAGGDLQRIPLAPLDGLIDRLGEAVSQSWPRPKMLIASFPHNPTTETVDLAFMTRLVEFCREHGMVLVHDFAYAEICYDGYEPPSALQVPGAAEMTIEFTSLSKSHAMAGWRIGFAAGNPELINILARVKSYLDYGVFQPIQIASIIALDGAQDCVREIVDDYRARRDALVEGLEQADWKIDKPLATMFVWAPLPETHAAMGSLEFSKLLLEKADVAVSPGVGFGPSGEGYVRFALVENTHRIRQAVRGIRRLLRHG
ncbi:MAG: aminotransferase class I/II-fold pyridoxal phosphate-dependent enzyme [Proteobacteria bacterium]|nr:aminotransferase class I/II-fold pyridoxal phosphate-dependent enzyme [Pseudomonadota bacterium]